MRDRFMQGRWTKEKDGQLQLEEKNTTCCYNIIKLTSIHIDLAT